MNSALRKRYVDDLVADLGLLTGAAFERFGYAIVDHVAPAKWKHRGTNLSGAPVKNVVDSVAEGGRLVAEYSTEEDYFAGTMTKVTNDIDHARTNHSNVEKLWLLSNRLPGPSQVTSVEALVGRLAATGLEITVLDARSIADHIVDNLLDERFIDLISAELSTLRRAQQEWAANHRVPAYKDYLARPQVEDAIKARLTADRRLTVSGISGLGKSAVCSAVARTIRGSYELVLWLNAAGIQYSEQLSAVDVLRNGEQQNIAGLMRARPCLVVLDDLRVQVSLEELMTYSHSGTHVLATSQFSGPGTYELEAVAPDLARAILQRGCPTACPDEIWASVYAAVGGHPLLLAILNGLAVTEGWAAVNESCTAAMQLEDKAHARVRDRILTMHAAALSKEISFIAWCGTPVIDEALWTFVLGPVSRRLLEARHFLAAGEPDVVRIHDLVFASITTSVDRAAAGPDFTEGLVSFIEKQGQEDRGHLLRFALLHTDLLTRLIAAGTPHPALRFALALTRPTDTSQLGNPLGDASRISPGGPNTELAVLAVLESLEAIYGSMKTTLGVDAAREWLATALPAFATLEALAGLRDESYRNIKHHSGKALMWLRREADAIAIFEALLRSSPAFHEARLQLARALTRQPDRATEAGSHVVGILQAAKATGNVARTVVLGAFELLSAHPLRDRLVETVTEYESLFLSALTESLRLRSDQAVHVLSVLGSALWYQAATTLQRVADILAARPYVPEAPAERFEWAQTLKFCAKALDVADPRRQVLLIDARSAYSTLEDLTHFQAVHYSECLLLTGEPKVALEVLERVVHAERNQFWYQRHAQALRALGRPAEGLTSIERAVEKEAGTYRAAMLHDRYLLRRDLHDPSAIDDLKEAISCASGRYRAQLEEELHSIEGLTT